MMKKKYSRGAMAISIVVLILWSIMGTGTSLAWFTDTDEEINNIFHFAEFDLEVSYKTKDGGWESMEGSTELFDKNALYEPGFTQVVYLKVENLGTVPFKFDTAVSVTDYNPGINVFGQKFNLQDHLRFGLVSNPSESALYEEMATRNLAVDSATTPLSNYTSDPAILDAGGTVYIALIVRMPEEVDNIANYREGVVPKVELGVIVRATQLTD